MCPLSNGYLLSTNHENNKSLSVYDDCFSLVLTIDKVNQENIQSLFLATNSLDRIYMNDYTNHQVIKTDYEFNYIKSIGHYNDNRFKYPCGLCYADKFLFVCDLYNKRIHKFDDNLEFIISFELNYMPWQIKIIEKVACIKPYSVQTLYFYNLETFESISKYEGHHGTLSVIDSCFYEYSSQNYIYYCFNKNGELKDQLQMGHLNQYLSEKNDGALVFFDKKLILASFSKKKFILIEN